ncbi:MAG: transporter substrate-binding domain-containing protein [Bacilli bacterium]|nr:transporter substrate-binding domain-containing protein [Bacilli bacterium]MDD4734250.1 transporter substrate-binding domain-containing protein [Bacilli bacterium]
MKKNSKLFLILTAIVLVLTGCSSKNLPKIESLSDLENKKVGIYTGSEYDTILKDKVSSAIPAYYNNYSDQISALKSGKIDGFLTDEPLAKEMIKNNDDIKYLDKFFTTDSYAFAINPKLTDLQEQVNTVINQMKQDGTLDKIADKWMGEAESKKVLPNYNYDTSKGTIKFATVSGSAPFAYIKDNKNVGYDIEVIMYIAKELNYKLEITEMSWEGVLPAIASGKMDMAGCSIIVTEERLKSVLFSEANFTGGIVVVVRK